VLELIGHYRDDSRSKDWHRLADEAVQRFPENTGVLLAATESAMVRKAYKKAAGFAHRLLKIDPINATVRRQMIELQVAHARKQVRAGRSDLAVKALAAAVEWERADAPSALLRIAQGLVEWQAGQAEQGQARLRQGVDLAGGGVGGWFRACLEAELMKIAGDAAAWLRRELASARETPPTRDAVMAVIAALGQPEVVENKRAAVGLMPGMRAWLTQAAALDWPAAEFQALAETLARFDAFDLLGDYARAARRREPTNPTARLHELIARTKGDSDRLQRAEANELIQMANAAAARQDFHAANRIERFLRGADDAPFGGPGRGRGRGRRAAASFPEDFADSLDADLLQAMIQQMMGGMSKAETKDLRELVEVLGWDGAVAQLTSQFQASAGKAGIPAPILRKLCEAIVAQAMEGDRPGQARASRRSPF
jgi:hypothetical protein